MVFETTQGFRTTEPWGSQMGSQRGSKPEHVRAGCGPHLFPWCHPPGRIQWRVSICLLATLACDFPAPAVWRGPMSSQHDGRWPGWEEKAGRTAVENVCDPAPPSAWWLRRWEQSSGSRRVAGSIPTLGVSKCPWARRLTPDCSWRAGWCLAWRPIAVGVWMCEWEA